MGIKKQKQKTKKQMKFIALASAALIATSSAINLSQVPAQTQLVSLMATKLPLKLDELFEALDTNKDGSLTLKEIITTVSAYAKEENMKLGKGWKKEVRKIFKKVDANGDKKVTMDEIKAAIWHAVDSDKDGEWSLTEVEDAIKAVAREAGAELKEGWTEEVAAAFKAVDTDASGKVSAKELEAAIKKHGYPDLAGLFKDE